jgi:membrane-associated phospholipid phosphatase
LGRLPKHVSPKGKSLPDNSIGDQKPNSMAQKWLVWIALAIAVLVALSRLFGD